MFVYVDPGHDTTTALRSWAVAHRGLWEALRERGRSIEVVAVVRTVRELQRALTILESWTNTSTASGPSAAPEPDSAARRDFVVEFGGVGISRPVGEHRLHPAPLLPGPGHSDDFDPSTWHWRWPPSWPPSTPLPEPPGSPIWDAEGEWD